MTTRECPLDSPHWDNAHGTARLIEMVASSLQETWELLDVGDYPNECTDTVQAQIYVETENACAALHALCQTGFCFEDPDKVIPLMEFLRNIFTFRTELLSRMPIMRMDKTRKQIRTDSRDIAVALLECQRAVGIRLAVLSDIACEWGYYQPQSDTTERADAAA